MSRPAPRPAARPATPAARPATAARSATKPATAARPAPAVKKPASPAVAARPATPGASGVKRPATGGPATAGRPSTGAISGARPTPGQLNNFLNLPGQGVSKPGASTLPSGANSAVAKHLQSPGAGVGKPGAGTLPARADGVGRAAGALAAGTGAVRVADRAGLRSNLADNRGERRTDRQQRLGDRADNIRDGLNDHYDHDHLFDDFWSDHADAHYHFHQNPVFWTWATWNTMRAFMPWNWGTPYYYDYGSGGNVYYEGDTVYASNTPVPASEYAEQAEELATSTPHVENPDQLEWLPLGVFALTQDGDPNAVPNMFLQLAVSKEGIIAGTYQNKSTGKSGAVEGMVDKDSQRAAWTIVTKNTPIMETGLSNLTMNETSALVHFADGQTQQWLMVRVENPEAK